MTASLVAACLWAVGTTMIALLPTRDHHWRAAYVMIGIGIPILGWVTFQNGAIVGLMVLVAAMSMLRWPLIYLWRWARRRLVG